MAKSARNVFINCPFGGEYNARFDAGVFNT
jgi:hypothetical protein